MIRNTILAGLIFLVVGFGSSLSFYIQWGEWPRCPIDVMQVFIECPQWATQIPDTD